MEVCPENAIPALFKFVSKSKNQKVSFYIGMRKNDLGGATRSDSLGCQGT